MSERPTHNPDSVHAQQFEHDYPSPRSRYIFLVTKLDHLTDERLLPLHFDPDDPSVSV